MSQGENKPAMDISAAIGEKYGFKPAVFSMDAKALNRAIECNPFKSGEGRHICFYFCDRTPKSVNDAMLKELKITSEKYAFKENVFYLYAPDGVAWRNLPRALTNAWELRSRAGI